MEILFNYIIIVIFMNIISFALEDFLVIKILKIEPSENVDMFGIWYYIIPCHPLMNSISFIINIVMCGLKKNMVHSMACVFSEAIKLGNEKGLGVLQSVKEYREYSSVVNKKPENLYKNTDRKIDKELFKTGPFYSNIIEKDKIFVLDDFSKNKLKFYKVN